MIVIKGTIDRFEEQHAVIRLADGQEIIWPINHLAPEFTAGQTLTLQAELDSTALPDNTQRAKNILNRILNNS